MKTWIAPFRCINVGGNRVLPMKSLVATLESIGCADVRTYVQSGNAVFRSAAPGAARLAARIRRAVGECHGFGPAVLVLAPAELQRALADNPFPQAGAAPKSVHLFFLAEAPRHPDLESLDAASAAREAFALAGKVFYLHTPDGFGKSKLAARVERCLGVEATARNLRTVAALVELARSAQGAA
jgi:uncharacterized protein (DUF1697 family)